MNELETYLFEKLNSAIETIPEEAAREIYALYIVCSLDEGGAYRPYIASLAWLEESKRASVHHDYGHEFSGWGASGETILGLCDEASDLHGFTLQSEFFRSQLQTDLDRERFALLEKIWPVRWDEHEISPSDWDAAQKLLAGVGVAEKDRKYLFLVMLQLVPFKMSEAFFEPLQNALRELQQGGIVERKCGRAVPIGVMATNDVGYEWGIEPTQSANPRDLAREILEWMRGEEFAVSEAREQLETEIARLPMEEQAQFWVECKCDIFWFFEADKRTPLIADLEKRGLLEKSANIHRDSTHSNNRISLLLPLAAPLLMDLIERNASNAPTLYDGTPKPPAELAIRLLDALQSGARDGMGSEVDDATVARIETLMHALWPEAQAMFQNRERVGYCLDYCARVLHCLRPEKYPLHRIHPRLTAAFNFEDFGLQQN